MGSDPTDISRFMIMARSLFYYLSHVLQAPLSKAFGSHANITG